MFVSMLHRQEWLNTILLPGCLVPRPVSGHVVQASDTSPNELTERDWENAVQGLANLPGTLLKIVLFLYLRFASRHSAEKLAGLLNKSLEPFP